MSRSAETAIDLEKKVKIAKTRIENGNNCGNITVEMKNRKFQEKRG
jgi:hypothetical protein